MSNNWFKSQLPSYLQTPRQSSNGSFRQVTSVHRSVTTETVASSNGLRERMVQRQIQQVVTQEVSINGQRYSNSRPSDMFDVGSSSNRGRGVGLLPQLPPPTPNKVALVPQRQPSNNSIFNTFHSRLSSQQCRTGSSGGPSRGRLSIPFEESRRAWNSCTVPRINIEKPYTRLPLSPRTTQQPRSSVGPKRMLVEDKSTQTSPEMIYRYMAQLQRKSPRYLMSKTNEN